MMLERVTAILPQHSPILVIWPYSHVTVVRRYQNQKVLDPEVIRASKNI